MKCSDLITNITESYLKAAETFAENDIPYTEINKLISLHKELKMSNNIVLKKGALYYSLADGDIIQPTDLVREYSSEKSPYKSAEYYPVYFHTAKENMPGWVGKTVGEFHSAILKLGITELDILREFEL